jgi:HAD superfamily hydrolase (TIGR01490 family)
LSPPGKRVSVFDVDYTVVRKSCTWYFVLEALERGLIGLSRIRTLPFEWLRYKLGAANEEFIEEAVRHIAGFKKSVLEETAAACFEYRIKANIYHGAARLIRAAQDRGELVIFASSTLRTLIKPLEDFFGITGSIASSLEFSDGVTTGRLEEKSFFGSKKKAAVESWLGARSLSPALVSFYSDSYTDLPLLEYCGHPVAVNPDRFLEREAKKRDWEIMRFRKTMYRGAQRVRGT